MWEKYPDIYFEPKWGKLHEEKDGGIHECYLFENELGKIHYSYIKREIDILLNGKRYYDITSPYGFGGPIILERIFGKDKELVKGFKEAFDNYCNINNIITDSCRFSPWLKNHIDFMNMYELVPNNTTLGINLRVDDVFLEELSSKKRNMIRKARKMSLDIHFDFKGLYVQTFLDIYEKTIIKNNITNYYRFSKDFIKNFFQMFDGRVFFAFAELKGKIISIALFLKSNYYIHYHLAANDVDYFGIPANDLLIYEVAEYSKKEGFNFLMLGGAGNNRHLHNHKLGFTKKSIFPFYKGRRICDNQIYMKILDKCTNPDMDFFPSYR